MENGWLSSTLGLDSVTDYTVEEVIQFNSEDFDPCYMTFQGIDNLDYWSGLEFQFPETMTIPPHHTWDEENAVPWLFA